MPKATKSCHKLPKVADSLSNAHKALLKIYKQAKHKVASNNNVNSVVITQCKVSCRAVSTNGARKKPQKFTEQTQLGWHQI